MENNRTKVAAKNLASNCTCIWCTYNNMIYTTFIKINQGKKQISQQFTTTCAVCGLRVQKENVHRWAMEDRIYSVCLVFTEGFKPSALINSARNYYVTHTSTSITFLTFMMDTYTKKAILRRFHFDSILHKIIFNLQHPIHWPNITYTLKSGYSISGKTCPFYTRLISIAK